MEILATVIYGCLRDEGAVTPTDKPRRLLGACEPIALKCAVDSQHIIRA